MRPCLECSSLTTHKYCSSRCSASNATRVLVARADSKRELVRSLVAKGYSRKRVAEVTGFNSHTISDLMYKMNLKQKYRKYDWSEVQLLLNEGYSRAEVCHKLLIPRRSLQEAITEGKVTLSVGKRTLKRYSLEEYFASTKLHCTTNFKKRLIKEGALEYRCYGDGCGISEWKGKALSLHLDHKDGNRRNNKIENIRFLCPNCHSQTETYGGKNLRNPNRTKKLNQ